MLPLVRFLRPVLLVTSACLLPTGAQATARVCGDLVAGDMIEHDNVVEAKKRALESWNTIASQSGVQYAGWPLATNRSLSCSRTDKGQHRCKAAGHPCKIQQAPPPIGKWEIIKPATPESKIPK